MDAHQQSERSIISMNMVPRFNTVSMDEVCLLFFVDHRDIR